MVRGRPRHLRGVIADYSSQAIGVRLPPDNAQNWWRHQWAELGLVGAFPAFACSLLALAAALRSWRRVRRPCAAALRTGAGPRPDVLHRAADVSSGPRGVRAGVLLAYAASEDGKAMVAEAAPDRPAVSWIVWPVAAACVARPRRGRADRVPAAAPRRAVPLPVLLRPRARHRHAPRRRLVVGATRRRRLRSAGRRPGAADHTAPRRSGHTAGPGVGVRRRRRRLSRRGARRDGARVSGGHASRGSGRWCGSTSAGRGRSSTGTSGRRSWPHASCPDRPNYLAPVERADRLDDPLLMRRRQLGVHRQRQHPSRGSLGHAGSRRPRSPRSAKHACWWNGTG